MRNTTVTIFRYHNVTQSALWPQITSLPFAEYTAPPQDLPSLNPYSLILRHVNQGRLQAPRNGSSGILPPHEPTHMQQTTGPGQLPQALSLKENNKETYSNCLEIFFSLIPKFIRYIFNFPYDSSRNFAKWPLLYTNM